MLNILVVDDSKSARNRVVKTLDNLKLDCNIIATAEDGVDALKKYLQFKPNLVITDIEMPNMDGAELILNLKKCTFFSFFSSSHPIHVIREDCRQC